MLLLLHPRPASSDHRSEWLLVLARCPAHGVCDHPRGSSVIAREGIATGHCHTSALRWLAKQPHPQRGL